MLFVNVYSQGTLDVAEDSDTFGRIIFFVQLRFAEEYKVGTSLFNENVTLT